MKFFYWNPNEQDLTRFILSSPIHGVFLNYHIQNFLYGDTFTNINIIKDKVSLIAAYGKKTALSITWGASCGTTFYNQFPYIELTEKHHEGTLNSTPVFNKFPVFYEADYIVKVDSFLQWLAVGLQPVINHIDHIKIGGINQTTFELRCPNQDFKYTDAVSEAYEEGAEKWLDNGYTTYKVGDAYESIITSHREHFPNTLKIASLIGGKNGWPCINDNGFICEPKDRPNITDRIINYCKAYPNIGIQATALTEAAGTPKNFVDSGLPMYYQLDALHFNKSVNKEKFEGAVLNALRHNGKYIEVFKKNVQEHSDIILKYV